MADFDIKEFTKWWEKEKENGPILNARVDEALAKAKHTLVGLGRRGRGYELSD